MNYGPIVATLRVKSVAASLAFYTQTLDFTMKWSWSDAGGFEGTEDPSFACLECGDAVVFLSQHRGGAASWLFVELPFLEDVATLAARLQEHVKIEGPESQPWGSREFLLADPDGHRLQFSCPEERTRGSSNRPTAS